METACGAVVMFLGHTAAAAAAAAVVITTAERLKAEAKAVLLRGRK